MPDNGVSISRRILQGVAGIMIGMLILGATFAWIRLREVYHLEAKIALVQQEQQQILEQRTTLVRDIDKRLDDLERAVFGAEQPPPAPATAGVEYSILFRKERELRERVTRLEQWRLKSLP